MGFFDFLKNNKDEETIAYERFIEISSNFITAASTIHIFASYTLKSSGFDDNDIRVFESSIMFGILVGVATFIGEKYIPIPEKVLFIELEKSIERASLIKDEKLNQKQIQEICSTVLSNQLDNPFKKLITSGASAVHKFFTEESKKENPDLLNVLNFDIFYDDKTFLSEFKSKIHQ